MTDNLSIHYDEEADFLEFRIGTPTDAYFEDIGDDVFRRIDRQTNEVKGFAIFNFKKRTSEQMDINVALPVKLKIEA